MESCSTLATNVEQYSLFGNSGPNQSVNILTNFSNVKISPPSSSSRQFGDGQIEMNGDWNSISDSPAHSNVESESDDLQRSFDNRGENFECYDPRSSSADCENDDKDGDENDRNDDIVNLELISGQTLAEKIANAENDIRNENEIFMRGIKEHAFRMMNNANVPETGCSDSDQPANPICNVESCCQNNIEESHEGISTEQEQTCLSVKTRPCEYDCLTENSVDFVTAENSISDAESSTEFGDAENSLELEDDLAEKCELDNDIPGAQSIVEDQSDENIDCYNSSPNVPHVDDQPTCNNIDDLSDTKQQSDQLGDKMCNSDSPTSLVNGDLTEAGKLAASCGEFRSFCIE